MKYLTSLHVVYPIGHGRGLPDGAWLGNEIRAEDAPEQSLQKLAASS